MSFMLLGILQSQASGPSLPSPTAGYWAGRDNSPNNRTVNRLDFNTEVRTVAPFTLRIASRNLGTFSDAGVAGYFVGGSDDGTPFSNVDKVDFATETRAATTALISSQYGTPSNLGNRNVAGYMAVSANSDGAFNKLAFPTDTRSYFSTSARYRTRSSPGATNFAVAGYVYGGDLTANRNDLAKLNYSTETWSTLADKLPFSDASQRMGGASNSGSASYLRVGDFSNRQRIYKMPFATETFSLLGTDMTASLYTSGIGNVGVSGYFAGGDNDLTNKIDKINFVNDTRSANYRQLSEDSYALSSIENGGANV